MSVYKEGFYAVELIQKSSKQIFPDAADFGAPVTKGDSLWNWVKQLVDWYGVKGSRKEYTYPTGATVESTVELMDEWNTGKVFQFKVTFVKSTSLKGMTGYVYVDQLTSVADRAEADAEVAYFKSHPELNP